MRTAASGSGRVALMMLVLIAGGCGGSKKAPEGGEDAERPTGARPCLVDPSDGRLKQCFFLRGDGRCSTYGPACGGTADGAATNQKSKGKGLCMRDARDGRYKRCRHSMPSRGCTLFGSPCSDDDIEQRSRSGRPCLQDDRGAYRECMHFSNGRCFQWGLACR